ncbi:MAG: arginyltransferase, partial [Alphaproteobacteria bacterium]
MPRCTVTSEAFRFPKFFVTVASPCPYLPGRFERKLFTELVGEEAALLHDSLAQVGFRRSQRIAYRPACDACSACLSVRIPVADYVFTRRDRRILRRNA